MYQEKMTTKISIKNFKKIGVATLLFYALLTTISFLSAPKLFEDSLDVYAVLCPCDDGVSSDQGCAANGCPSGTRRICQCRNHAGCDYSTGDWNCQCVADASCGGGGGGTTTCYHCAPWCAPYTGTSPCGTNCDACNGGGGGGGSCVPTVPGKATNPTPAIGATNVSAPVTLSWSPPSFWGTGCPIHIQYYRIYLGEIPYGSTCVRSASYPLIMERQENTFTHPVKWGATYCWLVRTYNSSPADLNTWSDGVWQFTTAVPPQASNLQVVSTASGCGGGSQISGSVDGEDTHNPITISVDVSDVRNDFANSVNVIESISLGVIPNTEQNSTYVTSAVLEPQLANRGLFQYTFPEYGGTGFSEKSNGSTTELKDIGTITHIEQIDNKTWRVYFNIEFKNSYPYSLNRFYIMAVSRTPDGTRVSNVADGLSNQNLRYVRSSQTWTVDTTAPVVTITPKGEIGAQDFNITWDANDTGGVIDFQSYCYIGSGTNTMHELDNGYTIPLSSDPLSYPDPGNCYVDESYLGTTASYHLDAPSAQVYLGGHATDYACNTSEYTYRLDSPVPWVLTNTGLVSASGGYSQFEIPAVDLSSHPQLGVVGDGSYLGSYSVYSGNNNLLNGRNSENNYYATNYTDTALLPPSISSVSSWYEQLYSMVSKKQTVVSILPRGNTLFENLSQYLSASVDPIKTAVVEGNATLLDMVCDTKAIIFVHGHLLISPDVTKTPGSSCLFVVSGDVLVTEGVHKGAASVSGSPALYDEINAFIIAEGAFGDMLDIAGGVGVPDGLLIRGGLIANSVELNRDLGRDGNAQGPAEAILLDPTIAVNMAPLLNINKFSLRSN